MSRIGSTDQINMRRCFPNVRFLGVSAAAVAHRPIAYTVWLGVLRALHARGATDEVLLAWRIAIAKDLLRQDDISVAERNASVRARAV
jgi:hypothetical protein